MIQVTRCRICDQPTESWIAGVRDLEYGAPGEYQWLRCTGCGAVALDPLPGPEILRLAYPPSYHAYLPPRSALTRRLRQLSLSRGFDGCNIKINSQDGAVRLSGTVQHELQKDYALEVVRNVDGVKSVQSDLQRF